MTAFFYPPLSFPRNLSSTWSGSGNHYLILLNIKKGTLKNANLRNIKYSILAFLIIFFSITISISTLAKTEVYPACACTHADRFSLYDNPQILSTTSLKTEVQTINTNTASQDEFLNILHISEPLSWKIIDFPFMSFPRTRESIIFKGSTGRI